MREEAESVIPRLRNHSSLAHWCGGSECDIAYYDDGGHFDPNTDSATSLPLRV
jgi:beta-galactosidase/beta-glucuronidase